MNRLATIFAHSSGRPPAAIAVIRISGPRAHWAGEQLAGSLPPPRQAAVRKLRSRDGLLLDEALVLRFTGVASATGEDLVELQCHGCRAVIDAVLAALAGLGGLREAMPGEFTRRAFENGRIDLTEAEGLADLLEAETESQRRAALALAEGGLRRQIETWQERLLVLSARAEAAIDYVEDDQTAFDPGLSRDCAALAIELGEWLARPRIERLKDGVRVVIAGPANAGKSSLLNAIAGEERAIVTSVPGTTRDQIEVPLSLAGIPIVLTDTAGVRDSDDAVERIGIERARRLTEAADILVWLGDPADAPSHSRRILVQPRSDLPGRAIAPDGIIPLSSMTGSGVAALLEQIAMLARDLVPQGGGIPINRRQANSLADGCASLVEAADAPDLVMVAEHLRSARSAFARLTGRGGVEEVLDALFGRFCLGK